MKDYISELCKNKMIKPVYTDNKHTVLSNGTQNGIPVLRIQRIFKNCSRKTAQAIINYYLEAENREIYTKQILTYTKKYLGAGEYKIAPLSDNFINAFICSYSFEEGATDFNYELAEHSIFSLIQKDSSSSHSKKITDGIIEVGDELIELDIVIDN